MLVLDKDNFAGEVLNTDTLVVVDYWGPKCEPCLALMPDVEKLAAKYEGRVKFGKVNTAENRRLAIEQKVLGLPTIAFYQGGAKIAQLTGNVTVDQIEAKINELLS